MFVTVVMFVTGFVWKRYDDNKEFYFSLTTLSLIVVKSLSDDSWLEIAREGGVISEIRHSDGSNVTIQYNGQNRIQKLELVTDVSKSEV